MRAITNMLKLDGQFKLILVHLIAAERGLLVLKFTCGDDTTKVCFDERKVFYSDVGEYFYFKYLKKKSEKATFFTFKQNFHQTWENL